MHASIDGGAATAARRRGPCIKHICIQACVRPRRQLHAKKYLLFEIVDVITVGLPNLVLLGNCVDNGTELQNFEAKCGFVSSHLCWHLKKNPEIWHKLRSKLKQSRMSHPPLQCRLADLLMGLRGDVSATFLTGTRYLNRLIISNWPMNSEFKEEGSMISLMSWRECDWSQRAPKDGCFAGKFSVTSAAL